MAGAFQPNAFQNDAFQVEVGGTVSDNFSADAVLFDVVSDNFVADSILNNQIIDDFTADAVVGGGGGSSFIADSILFGTPQSLFDADSILLGISSDTIVADAVIVSAPSIDDTFTADSILVRILVEDDFDRSTSSNEIGQPSDAGRYHEAFFFSPTEFEGHVNGTTWETDIPYGISGAYLSPFTPDFTVAFEFRIPDNDQFAGYQVAGLTVPHESSGSLLRKAILEIWEEGGGTWHLYAGGSASVTFSPTIGDWWQFKGFFDLTGGTSGAKVWKVGDPEPADWQITQVRSNWFSYSLSTSSRFTGQVWLYSGETQKAEIDNLLLQGLNTSGIREIFTADATLDKIVSSLFDSDSIIKGSIEDTVSADAVLGEDTGTFQGGFTADAAITAAVHNNYLTADSQLVITIALNFSVNAVLVSGISGAFSVNAWIRGVESRVFVARSQLVKPIYDQDDQVSSLHKRVSLHVQMRRPAALSAYVPPRNPDSEDDKDGGGISLPDCLPPCPPYPGSGIGGTNGIAIRRSIYFCDECDIYIYTSSNKMGRGPDAISTGHTGCSANHSRTLHMLKMFVDYSNIPSIDVGMIAKMVWDGDASQSVGVKVYANLAGMPSLDDDGQYSDSLSGLWTSGDYMGTMSFGATGAVVTDDGIVQFCHIPQSLTIRKSTLSTAIFRFELADTGNYYGAEFRSPNKPLDIEGL